MKIPTIHIQQPNLTCLTMGSLKIWYSYETPIGFFHDGGQWVVSQNPRKRGMTTGRHLNLVFGSLPRIPHEQFLNSLSLLLEGGLP